MTAENRKLVVQIIITALFLTFIAPAVSSGYHFHGGIVEGLICSALFAGIIWVLVKLRDVFIGSTLGIGAIPFYLFKLFFWWLIPAIQLELLAWLAPNILRLDGFGSAIWVGLIMMVINFLTIPLKRG